MHSVIPASFVSSGTRRNLNVEKGRNVVAAIFSAKLIVLLIMALALPNWYYLKGGGCSRQTLGTEQFIYVNCIGTVCLPSDSKNVSFSKLAYYGMNEDMKNCLTPEIVAIQRVVIALCFITIFFSFCQFYFDINGMTKDSFKCTHRCGLGSIFSAITIVVIIGLCYYVSDLMEQQQDMTKLYPATRVEVTFGISYYLIATAGVVAILATASNLFRCDHLTGNVDVSMLLDDNQEEETFSIALPHSQSWSHVHDQSGGIAGNLPPPPPYTP